jgi:hypothetical protein
MYEKMKMHVSAYITNPGHPVILKRGAEAGMKKLMKYYDIAQGNQMYTLGTGELLLIPR